MNRFTDGSLFCFLPLNLPVFPLESSGWCIQSLSSLLGVVLGVVLLDQWAKNLSLQNFGNPLSVSSAWKIISLSLGINSTESWRSIWGAKAPRWTSLNYLSILARKTDPMLVSVDPVEHRSKMYYVVKKKKSSGQYGGVADDSLLPLWGFLWFVVFRRLLFSW